MRCNFGLIGSAVLMALPLGPRPAVAGPRPSVSVVIQLRDQSAFRRRSWLGPKRKSRGHSWLQEWQIVWVTPELNTPTIDFGSSCRRQLQMAIIKGPQAEAHDQDSWRGALGKAQPTLGRAEVFYRRLSTAASVNPIALSLVLGHVISPSLAICCSCRATTKTSESCGRRLTFGMLPSADLPTNSPLKFVPHSVAAQRARHATVERHSLQ